MGTFNTSSGMPYAEKICHAVEDRMALLVAVEDNQRDVGRALEKLYAGDTQAAIRLLRAMLEE